MKNHLALLSIASLASFASAHFELDHPPARGFDEAKTANFPCGGMPLSKTRFPVSLTNPQLSVHLSMGHDESALQFLLGLGNDPGSNFNISLLPTMRQVGLGDFCLPNLSLSADVLGIPALTEGLNATLQVVTNGDPDGGLYNCADITFTSAPPPSDSDTCKNGTGVQGQFFTGDAAHRNANESTPDGNPQSGGGGSGGGSGGSSGGGSQGGSGSSAAISAVSWGLLGATVASALALL